MFDKYRDYQAKKESYAQKIYEGEYALLERHGGTEDGLYYFILMKPSCSCVPMREDGFPNYNVMVDTIYAYYNNGHPEFAEKFEKQLHIMVAYNFISYEVAYACFNIINILNYNQKNKIAPFDVDIDKLKRTFNEEFAAYHERLKESSCPGFHCVYDYIISKNAELEKNGTGILTEENKTR